MRKISLVLICICVIQFLRAQVKIGAPGDPDLNAVLELTGPRGLLLPRVTLAGITDPSPLSAHTAGMVVYNIATTADTKPGYYYNDGVKWMRISNPEETWSVNGNSGTNPATEFIGTTDAADFKIRTTNLDRIRIAASGWIEIGTSSLPNNVQLKIGGVSTGDSAAAVGLDPTINPTASFQTLYSFRNNPSFGTNYTASQVYGSATEFQYSGRAQSLLVASLSSVQTTGTNSNPGVVAGAYGITKRNSSGTGDGNYYGGHFRSLLSTGAGTLNESFGIYSNAMMSGTSAFSLSSLGGLTNLVTNSNPNAHVFNLYGERNTIQHSTNSTISAIYGSSNSITVNSGGTASEAYGEYISISTGGLSGTITSAFGLFINGVSIANIPNYRGIYIGNFAAGGSIKRPFEYAGSGENSPVIVNYDGSVLIGTSTSVTNAKLSVVNGHIQSGQTTKPTIVAGSAMGTGGTVSLTDATDVAGIINLNLGTSAWGSGQIAAITFNKAYSTPPIVIITPRSGGAALGVVNQRPFVITTTLGFFIHFGAPATSAISMQFNYYVIETVDN